MSLRRLVAIAVGCVMLASFVVMWLVFAEMWRTGTTVVKIAANRYGEFAIEATIYALSMVLLPVFIYEVDQLLRDS